MFSQWLFSLDDEYDEHPTMGRDPGAVRKLMTLVFDVLDSGMLPVRPTPFLHFTASVRRRLDALAPPGWTARFLGHVKDYLFRGSLRAVEYWARDRVPSLDEYLHVQRWSRGQSLEDAPLSKRGAPASVRSAPERHSQPPSR